MTLDNLIRVKLSGGTEGETSGSHPVATDGGRPTDAE